MTNEEIIGKHFLPNAEYFKLDKIQVNNLLNIARASERSAILEKAPKGLEGCRLTETEMDGIVEKYSEGAYTELINLTSNKLFEKLALFLEKGREGLPTKDEFLLWYSNKTVMNLGVGVPPNKYEIYGWFAEKFDAANHLRTF